MAQCPGCTMCLAGEGWGERRRSEEEEVEEEAEEEAPLRAD